MTIVHALAFALVAALFVALVLEQRARIRRDRANQNTPP